VLGEVRTAIHDGVTPDRKSRLTPQITGSKKYSDEGAALFAARVYLHCYVYFILYIPSVQQEPH
jgi:hypothetical protein